MAQLIYTLIPGNTGWDFSGINDYLDGCAVYGNCYGVSGGCGSGELGGFATNTGGNHLSIGTFNSYTYVQNRTAQWLMNTTNMEYMIVDVIAGSDFNGGERPNNVGESLYIKCHTGGDQSSQVLALSGQDGGFTYPNMGGQDSWTAKTISIPPANRGLFLWRIYAYSIAQPEFEGTGGIYASNVNAGDRYAISRIRIYGTVPTHIQYFRGNDESDDLDIYPGDPITFTWSTQLGTFAGATSGEIYAVIGGVETLVYSIPAGSILTGSYTLSTGPSVATLYRLKVNGNTGIASKDLQVNMLALDTSPDAISFDSVADAEVSTLYTSNTVTVNGVQIPVTLSVTNGATSSVNGGAYSTANKTVTNNDTITLQMTSSANFGTQKTTGVTVGDFNTTWRITTKSEPAQIPNSFTFQNVVDAPVLSYVLSNEVTITGITQVVPVSAPSGALDGFESRVNDGTGWGPWSADPKQIANGQKLQLRVLTSDVLGDTKTTGISVGAGSAVTWSVTNVTIADSNPDFFNFEDKLEQPASTAVTSDVLTITGINVPTTVTTTNGALISVNGSGFGTSPAQIQNNQTLAIRLTSSATPGGEVSTTITIGNSPLSSIADDWKVVTTTAGDIDPDAFYFLDKDNQPPNTYIESNTVLIQGITSPSPFTVTNGQASINGGDWVFTGQVYNGDAMKLRILTSPNPSTAKSISITVG